MAEITKVETPPQGDSKTATEVIGLDGKAGPSTTEKNLQSIFDNIEAGKKPDEAIQEVMTKPAPAPKEEVKEEEETPKKEEPTDLAKKLEVAQEKKEEEVSREKLLKETEEKKVEPPAEEAIPEDELQVLPHDKPKTAKRIQALLKKIEVTNGVVAQSKKESDERAAKLKELEGQLAQVKTVDPKTNEEVQKQLDELKMYRRRYQLESDPEVKTKFSDKAESAEASIIGSLKKNGAGQALLDSIKEEGGWVKFASSNRPMSIKDPETGEMTTVPAAKVADLVLNSFSFGERKAIEAATMEQLQTQRDRDRFFEQEQKTASEYFKKQEEEAKKGTEAYNKQVQETLKAIEEFKTKALTEVQWLKEKQVPEGATPEQKTAIEEDNKYTKQLGQLLQKNLQTKDMSGLLDIVMDSVHYYEARRENSRLLAKANRLEADLKAAKESLDKVKSGNRSVAKSGSIAPGAQSAAQAGAKTAPKTLEEALALREEGKLEDSGRVRDVAEVD